MSAITHGFLAAGGEPMEAVTAQMTRWCRRWSAKDLARLLDVSVRTAEGWRCGNWPQGRHLTAMVALWGTDWLAMIYKPVAQDAGLDRRLEAVEAIIADLKEDYRHAHPAPTRPAAAAPAHLGGGTSRPRGAVVATARALIVGAVIGAGLLHMAPQLPDTVAGLVEAAGEQYARLPRGTGTGAKGQRTAARATTGRREG